MRFIADIFLVFLQEFLLREKASGISVYSLPEGSLAAVWDSSRNFSWNTSNSFCWNYFSNSSRNSSENFFRNSFNNLPRIPLETPPDISPWISRPGIPSEIPSGIHAAIPLEISDGWNPASNARIFQDSCCDDFRNF